MQSETDDANLLFEDVPQAPVLTVGLKRRQLCLLGFSVGALLLVTCTVLSSQYTPRTTRHALPDGALGQKNEVQQDSRSPGEFLTSEDHKTFPWGTPTRTLDQAFDAAFANGFGGVHFKDGLNKVISREALLDWTKNELINGQDPFGKFDGKVPVPFGKSTEDQLDPGQWVAYSRRQVCMIIAKSLTGAGTEGYSNGLVRFLDAKTWKGCTPLTGDFGRALWDLIAACAADPALENGGQGPMLVVAKASDRPSVEDTRTASKVDLSRAGLRVCQYGDGAQPIDGVEHVPGEGCTPATDTGPGRDFMTGGLEGQAVQDISAEWLGGYIWGNECGLGGGQDERLMVYMPEVFALAFFLSQAPGTDPQQHNTPQLRQPAWVLGARRLLYGLDGTGRFNKPANVDLNVPIVSDLVDVKFEGRDKTYGMSSSRPFLAFMSESQDLLDHNKGCDLGCATRKARINRHPNQRAVDPSVSYAFEKQVRAWYGSVALTSYHKDLHPVFRSVVKSIGAGPWLAGLWWGDSQLGILAMWLGHAAAASTWGDATGAGPLPLDYYTYSAFTENPGNQCYIHPGESCKACLQKCGTPPKGSFWLPGFAYTGAPDGFKSWGPAPPPAKACVDDPWSCGAAGLGDIIAKYKAGTAQTLWDDVERALKGEAANVDRNVFDVLVGK